MTYGWKGRYSGCVEIYKYMYRKWPRRTDLRRAHIKRWLQTEPWRHWLQIPPPNNQVYTRIVVQFWPWEQTIEHNLFYSLSGCFYIILLNFRRVKREWIKDFHVLKGSVEHRNFVTCNPFEVNIENDPFQRFHLNNFF